MNSSAKAVGQPLPAKIHLEARLDSDAATKSPTDPTATAEATADSTFATLK